jgi:type I restriction enzyme, S subunit
MIDSDLTKKKDSSQSFPEELEFSLSDWHMGRIHPMPSKIPDNWRLVQLTTVAKLESGHTPSRRQPAYWVGNIPWISLHDSKNLDNDEILETENTIGELGLQNSSARLLPKGTVVFSRTATVGKSTVMGREMTTSQDFANFICGSKLFNRYLAYLFRYMQPEWIRLMAGSTHNTIYMPVFREMKILLPPIAEQNLIASALSDTDALIESLEQLLAKKRQIKQGAMQELLTGKKRLSGFGEGKGYKQSEIGTVPEDWEVKFLGELFHLINGFSFKSEHFASSGPIVLTPGNFQLEGGLYFDGRNTKRYSGDFPTSTIFNNGDLLVVMTDLTPDCNLLGKPAFVFSEEKVLHNQRIGKVQLLVENIDKQFLYFSLLSRPYLRKIKEQATGSTVRHTSNKSIYSISLPIPPFLEQTAIATILSDMDLEIGAIETKLTKARQLKQGMMHELLTGRIRLL